MAFMDPTKNNTKHATFVVARSFPYFYFFLVLLPEICERIQLVGNKHSDWYFTAPHFPPSSPQLYSTMMRMILMELVLPWAENILQDTQVLLLPIAKISL